MYKTITNYANVQKYFSNFKVNLENRLSLIGTIKKNKSRGETGINLLFFFGILIFLTVPYNRVVAQNSSNITLKGKVLDAEDNSSIPGVSLTNAITKKVLAQTNEKGEFSTTVAKGTIINFNMLGYTTHAVTYQVSNSNITIKLKQSTNTLNAVVVTALGIKREEKSLGYATTTVTNEQLTDAIAGNWTDALSGKVAGLNLVRSGAGPTGSNKIILRGENNLTGDNEALIVVDGVVVNQGSGRRTANSGESVYATSADNLPADYGSGINDINPEDIESVTVLKGPGAAALYGSRGANGAIIITTKSGTVNKKGFGVTINSNTSFESVNRWPDLQYEYGQGLDGADYYSYGAGPDGASTSGTSSAYGPRFDGQSFFQYDPILQKVGANRTPWVAYGPGNGGVNDYFKVGSTYNNSISVDGGTDRTTARLSLSDVRNQWIMPNTGYNRNNVALSVNSKVNDKLTIASKVTYSKKWSDNLPSAGYGNQSVMYWYIFWQPNADINWLRDYWKIGQQDRKIQYPFSSFPENPFAIANEFLNKSNRNAITGNVTANYAITKKLSVQLRSSLDMGYEQRSQERPYDAGAKLVKGSYRTQNIYSQEISSDFLVRYNDKFGKDFSLTASAGGSMLKNIYQKDEVRADSLVYPGIYTFSNAAGPLVTMPRKTQYAFNSFYGLASLGYKDYLYMDLTARQDWTSTLATPSRTDNVAFFYPSVSVSFLPNVAFSMPKAFNYAKLRASWSKVGSGSTNPYMTAFNYVSAGSLYSGGLANPGTLINPNLQPLTTTTFEVGAEAKMFKNRFGFDIALYSGNTKDQILNRIVDRSTGFSQMIINAGVVGNQGIEIAVNGTPVKSKNGLTWNTSYTFSANRNTIKELADSSVVLRTGPVGGGQIVAKVGGSMGDVYGRGFVRSPDGQVVFNSITGTAMITQDVVYIGNTIPKWKMSWNNEFKYKQFRLNVLFDAQFGAVAHSLMNYKMTEQGKLKSTIPGRYSGIIGNGVVQNPDGSYRKNDVLASDIDEYYRSIMGIDNAEGSTFSTDFIKFREANLSYTLTNKMTKKLGLQKASIGVYGRNLFIWSPWPMFDPEFGTMSGTDIVQGFETAQFPSTRTFGLSVIVGF